MGVVYEVEHEHTGQRLALKLLTQQPGASVERFRREARAASLIKSDHIVRVTDAGLAPELGDAPFLVMELLDGQDLERATGDRPASPSDVVEWLRQVARALVKAHDAGLVHRDLKPENLFLTRGDRRRASREDPRLRHRQDEAAEASLLTASDAFLGTPGYMAPEQTDSRGPPVTFRADLYTLGLIAFKLLTGRIYWRSGSLAQLLSQILAEPMPAPSERGSTFGPAFDAWFLRACDRDPEKRFASASEQVEALAVALGLPEAPRVSHPTPVSAVTRASETQGAASLNGSFTDLTTARKRTARRRLYGGGLVAGMVGLGIAATLLRAPPRETRPLSDGSGTAISALAPDSMAPAILPDGSSGFTEPVASAAPSGSASSVALTPAPASSTAKRNHVPFPASSRTPAPAASHGRDPLEGPW